MENTLQPVTNFDVNRYCGTWYEIARLPASFEKDMIQVTATYSLNDNGTVKVLNQGLKNGKQKKATGRAKFAADHQSGYLKVSFFWPFYADYKIIELDSNYTYAMVASSFKYLWILCREPHLDESIVKKLVDRAQMLGFKTEHLYFTPQKNRD